MKKLIAWYSGWSLATRYFMFLFPITLVIFLLLAFNNFKDAENIYKSQMIHDNEILIERTNNLIDSYLDNIQNILLILTNQNSLLAQGKEQETRKILEKYADMNSSMIRNIYFIRQDGKVIANNQVYYEIMGNPHLQMLYRQALDNYGAINVSEPYDTLISGRTLAFMRPVKTQSGRVAGVIVIEIDLNQLTNRIAPLLTNQNQTFTIISSKGHPITSLDLEGRLLPRQKGVYPPQLTNPFLAKLRNLAIGVNRIKGLQGSLIAVKSSPDRLGWSLIEFIDTNYFYKSIQTLNKNYQTAGVVWFIVLIASAWFMSRHFSRPIRTLVAKMDRFRSLEEPLYIMPRREDEIGRLAKSYNAMMERIFHLNKETKQMEQAKKEYELKMLQSQIAPHFLYNTLACISSLAKQNRIREVRETVKSLVGLLSLSFGKSSEFVTLEEEIEGIHKYVYIQKIRYGDKFDVDYAFDTEILSCKMLRLTLQPLVENAVYHGFAAMHDLHGVIQITGKRRGNQIVIQVRDNGRGIEPDRLRRLLEQGGSKKSKFQFSGIGLANVHDRIRLYFGDAYGIKIRSISGAGTIIRVALPFLTASPGDSDAKSEIG